MFQGRRPIQYLCLIFVSNLMFLIACQPISPIETPQEPSLVHEAPIKNGPVTITDSTIHGTFGSTAYFRTLGTVEGSGASGPYIAPFEIIAPVDAIDTNGRVVLEPLHFIGGAIARNDYLTQDFLFGQGFSSAGICLQQSAPFVPEHPCAEFSGEAGMEAEIVAAFAKALRENSALSAVVGQANTLYATGVAATVNPLHSLILSDEGQSIFELSLFVATGWPLPFGPPPATLEDYMPPMNSGRVLALTTESDIFQYNGAGLRIDDLGHSTYRLYEIAGGPHIADTPGTRARFVGPPQSPFPSIADTTPLDWSPVLRAMFVAGDQWVVDGIEPPASVYLERAAEDEIDSVYKKATGIARDENLNALGGIRLPDLALGRGQFIAADAVLMPEPPHMMGGFVDLKCTPLADGSIRFPDHDEYIRQYAEFTEQLVSESFLLTEDAEAMIEAATESDIGIEGACQ
ncbi:MAG: alpha/beta hydrolase domain-containing protein [Chloroflexota bacterium]